MLALEKHTPARRFHLLQFQTLIDGYSKYSCSVTAFYDWLLATYGINDTTNSIFFNIMGLCKEQPDACGGSAGEDTTVAAKTESDTTTVAADTTVANGGGECAPESDEILAAEKPIESEKYKAFIEKPDLSALVNGDVEGIKFTHRDELEEAGIASVSIYSTRDGI